jgi:hypothetical protein
MSLIKHVKKGPSMNTFEQFYIQLYALNNKLVNEQYPGEHNPVSIPKELPVTSQPHDLRTL